MMYTTYWELIWDGKITEAAAYGKESGLDACQAIARTWFADIPVGPSTSPIGAAFKYAASVLGMPIGDYPYSRPPQGILPEAAKPQLQTANDNAGMVGKALVTA